MRVWTKWYIVKLQNIIYVGTSKYIWLIQWFSFVCMQFQDISISYFIDTGKSIIWFKHYNYVLICIRKSTKGSNRTERVLFIYMYERATFPLQNVAATAAASHATKSACERLQFSCQLLYVLTSFLSSLYLVSVWMLLLLIN